MSQYNRIHFKERVTWYVIGIHFGQLIFEPMTMAAFAVIGMQEYKNIQGGMIKFDTLIN